MSVWLAGCATSIAPIAKKSPSLLGIQQAKAQANVRTEFVFCSPENGPWSCAAVTPKTRISAVRGSDVATVRADLSAASSREHPAPFARAIAPSDRPVAEPTTNSISPHISTPALGVVYFDFDKDELRAEAKIALLDLLPKLRESKIKLSGYTDSVGAELYNDHLALRRALNVRSFLITAGVNLLNLDAVGDGLCCYIAPNGNDEERQKNRRVEVHIAE